MAYSYNEILWSNQNEWTFSTYCKMDESHKYNSEQKRTGKTAYIVWFYSNTVKNQPQLVYWVRGLGDGYLGG